MDGNDPFWYGDQVRPGPGDFKIVDGMDNYRVWAELTANKAIDILAATNWEALREKSANNRNNGPGWLLPG